MNFVKSLSIQKVSEGVFYGTDNIIFASQEIVYFLKEEAKKSPLLRARLCAHPGPDSTQHDMLIVTHQSSYVAPHRHNKKSETLLILEGEIQLLLFTDNGECYMKKKMSSYSSGGVFFYRMPQGVFHSMIINSEWLVFQESTKGPFDITETDYPNWAPSPTSRNEGKKFLCSF